MTIHLSCQPAVGGAGLLARSAMLLAAPLAAAWRALSRWARYRRTVNELRRLDARILQDIGLRRDQLDSTARSLSRRSGEAWR